jgi:hypothetical protein
MKNEEGEKPVTHNEWRMSGALSCGLVSEFLLLYSFFNSSFIVLPWIWRGQRSATDGRQRF